jgi:hypothetical protein
MPGGHFGGGWTMVSDETVKSIAMIWGALSVRVASDLSAELASEILPALTVDGMAIYRADGIQ